MKKRMTASAPAAEVSAVTQAQADRRTRDRVSRLLLERGSATTNEIAAALGLTPAAIRRHLDAMLGAGTIVSRAARVRGPRMRGRPARVFALSDAGHAAGPAAYDDIAVDALRYLNEAAGPDAVEGFARRRMATWESRYADELTLLPIEDRPAALAAALTADGFAATVAEGGCGVQLCQHHCPVQHVAEEFPVLCEVETEVLGRLVGRHVQRLATISHGDGVCTTHIPLHALPAPTNAEPLPAPEPATSGRTRS